MYNNNAPTRAELPTSKQLLRSTFLAIVAALALLITTVLPAEYGIDPLGVGRALGLTKMGEIKVALAAEANSEGQAGKAARPTAVPVATAPASSASPVQVISVGSNKKDQMTITLRPDEGAEVKLAMSKDDKVGYQWTASGPLNVDAHGDPTNSPKGFYHGYGKARQVKGDSGVIQAAFDGRHGWYWRNRSGESITIQLSTEGRYKKIDRVL